MKEKRCLVRLERGFVVEEALLLCEPFIAEKLRYAQIRLETRMLSVLHCAQFISYCQSFINPNHKVPIRSLYLPDRSVDHPGLNFVGFHPCLFK